MVVTGGWFIIVLTTVVIIGCDPSPFGFFFSLSNLGCTHLTLPQVVRNPYGGFHSHGRTPIAGWFREENPMQTDDFGVPPF